MTTVEKPQQLPREKHVVRITMSGSINLYVAYAERQLHDPAVARVELRAVAGAIVKVVSVAEIIKRNNPGLCQETTLSEAPPTPTPPPTQSTDGAKPSQKPPPRARIVSALAITLINDQ